VHALLSLQLVVVGHVEAGSHVSPFSTTPLPHLGAQSVSLMLLQPGAQQPSPLLQAVTAVKVQVALQLAALPASASVVHALLSLQLVGQLDAGSHVSPSSITPFPHLAEQSVSLVELQPGAQQPSPLMQVVIAVNLHTALHVAALPDNVSVVQALLSLQLVGQLDAGSHVSPVSTTPLPHLTAQSVSLVLLHPEGQHPSPLLQVLIVVNVHLAVHAAALPVSVSVVQALLSLQEVGQLETGSQVSPVSMTAFPHFGAQSVSLVLLQLEGQHPSPPLQTVIAENVHLAVHAAALPVSVSVVQALLSLQEVGQLETGSHVSPVSTAPFPQTGPLVGTVTVPLAPVKLTD
jgi:hypothetical protein